LDAAGRDPLKHHSVEIAARDPRLIGDQNHRKPRAPQQAKPLDRAWGKLDSVRVPQVDLSTMMVPGR
jgi:hypothetical protein